MLLKRIEVRYKIQIRTISTAQYDLDLNRQNLQKHDMSQWGSHAELVFDQSPRNSFILQYYIRPRRGR